MTLRWVVFLQSFCSPENFHFILMHEIVIYAKACVEDELNGKSWLTANIGTKTYKTHG
jgi:hypothetical protein